MPQDNTKKKPQKNIYRHKWEEYLKPFEDLKIEIKNIYFPELEYEKTISEASEEREVTRESQHDEKPSKPIEIPLTISASLKEAKEYFKPYDPIGILSLTASSKEKLPQSAEEEQEKESASEKESSQKIIATIMEENEPEKGLKPSHAQAFSPFKSWIPKDLGMPSLTNLKGEFEASLKNVFKDNKFLEATYESLNMTKNALSTFEDIENIIEITHTPIERYLEVYKRKIDTFFSLNEVVSLPSSSFFHGLTGVILGKNKQGIKTSSLEYDHGQLNGISATYHPNGSMKEQMSYQDGKLNGIYETYDKEGNLVSSLMFKDGKLNGLGTFYEQGRKYAEFEFIDGVQQGSSNTYYETGMVMTSCTYASGKMAGDYKIFNDQGNISSVVAYKEGLKDGATTSYYATGEILETGSYTLDLKDGTFVTYYQNGNPNQISQYQNGQLIDPPTLYTLKGREIDS